MTNANARSMPEGGGSAAPGAAARALAVATVGYKRFISPLLPPACRFTPTCSEFAREAFLKHGVFRGAGLALKRLGRCHPFSRGGHDPVP